MFRYALNTSTVHRFGLDVTAQIEVAAEAGYDGIELWMDDIRKYIGNGGAVSELARRIRHHGLEFSDTIAFQAWCSKEDVVRRQALENVKDEMEIIAELGGKAYAAPPWNIDSNATTEEIAGYFDELSKVGRALGVEPYLEFWGHAPALNSLEQAAAVLECSRTSSPRLLADVYHIYRSGGRAEALRALPPGSIGIFHVNDFPDIPSQDIHDDDRVFPGEGWADWQTYRTILSGIGYAGMLSVELFLKTDMDMTAMQIARKGLETSRGVMDR